jgi:hypothetical protein
MSLAETLKYEEVLASRKAFGPPIKLKINITKAIVITGIAIVNITANTIQPVFFFSGRGYLRSFGGEYFGEGKPSGSQPSTVVL